jgi:MscS family membrane protein
MSVATTKNSPGWIPIFSPRECVVGLGTGACFLFLTFLLCFSTGAQIRPPTSVPVVSKPEAPKDSLGRTTPQGTVLGFLNASHKGDYELAAGYLNTRLRGKAASDLAHQLYVVLDRRLPARLNQLSDNPEGSFSTPLKPNQELVGTISSNHGKVDIFVERVDRGKAGFLWLFSSETLDAIPDLYDEVNEVSVDTILPEFLASHRIAGIVLFEWLAVLVGMPLLYFLIVLLNRILSRLVGGWRRRLYKRPELPDSTVFPKPVRLLLLAFLIYWITSKLRLSLLERQFWISTVVLITIAACTWLLILLNSRGETYILRRFRNRNLTGATSMLRLARRVVDLLIIFVGVLVTTHYFGLNPSAALAGLGVGGIAVAFAAQKTLENVIGGVSVIFDQTVRAGDFIKVGDTQGTVQEIGLRSTRIRTLDRTVVSVPNGQIANMTLENLSSRDKFWFHPILSLRHGTTAPQMHSVLDRIRTLLKESPYLESNTVRVRLLRFGPTALDVEVFAYVLTWEWTQFLEVQEELLLRIMECLESTGVQIALPQQTILATASAAHDAAGLEAIKAPTSEKKPNDNAAAAKSA